MLKSNDKSRSIDQDRPLNTNSSSVSFFRLNEGYGPREYGKSNKTLPSTQSSPLYHVNNVSLNFLSNEHLKHQYWNKEYKTETDWIGIKQNVRKKINHLIKTNLIYHLLEMTTIQQLPQRWNIYRHKRPIQYLQKPSTQ